MNGIEHFQAVALAQWWAYNCRRFGIDRRLFYPNLNGGFRHPRTAMMLKAEGSVPGIADYFLAVPRQYMAGLYLELKAGGVGITKGRPSKDQIEFGRLVSEKGYKFVIAYGTDEAIKAIEDYLK